MGGVSLLGQCTITLVHYVKKKIHKYFDGSAFMSDGLSGAESRRPRPLEVVTAEMTCNIDYFADKEQSGNSAALHGFCRQFIRVNPAGSHLGFFVAFRSLRQNFPAMNLALHFVERGIVPALRRVQFKPALCQSDRQ